MLETLIWLGLWELVRGVIEDNGRGPIAYMGNVLIWDNRHVCQSVASETCQSSAGRSRQGLCSEGAAES